MPVIDTDWKLSFTEARVGPSVLLIHRLPRDHKASLPQIEARKGQYRVTAADNRSALMMGGDFDPICSPKTIELSTKISLVPKQVSSRMAVAEEAAKVDETLRFWLKRQS